MADVGFWDGKIAYDEATGQPKYILKGGKWQPYGSGGVPNVTLSGDAQSAIGKARDAAKAQMDASPLVDRFINLNKITPTGPIYGDAELPSWLGGGNINPFAAMARNSDKGPDGKYPEGAGARFQEMEGITKQMIPLRHITTGPMTDSDARNYEKSLPSVGKYGNANVNTGRGMQQVARNLQGYAEFLQDFATRNAGQILGADEEWMRYMTANPIYGADGALTKQRPHWRDWYAQNKIPRINSDAEYAALPKNAEFIGPDGARRRKP